MIKTIKRLNLPYGLVLKLYETDTNVRQTINDLRNDIEYYETGKTILHNSIFVFSVPRTKKVVHLAHVQTLLGATAIDRQLELLGLTKP